MAGGELGQQGNKIKFLNSFKNMTGPEGILVKREPKACLIPGAACDCQLRRSLRWQEHRVKVSIPYQ